MVGRSKAVRLCLKVAKPTFCTKASESLLEVWLDLVARLLRNTLMASKESPEKWSKVCQVVNPRTRRLTLQRHQEAKLAHSMKEAEPQLLSNQVVAEPNQSFETTLPTTTTAVASSCSQC